jgi:hypothetical protein
VTRAVRILALLLVVCFAPQGARASTSICSGSPGLMAGRATSGGSQQIPNACAANPLTILGKANVCAWYRLDQGVTIATGVSQLNDLSGNGNTAIQATGSKQCTYVSSYSNLGGRPAMLCAAASDQYLLVSSFTCPYSGTPTFWAWIVTYQNSNSTYGTILSTQSTAAGDVDFRTNSNSNKQSVVAPAGNPSATWGTATNGAGYAMSGYFQVPTTNHWTVLLSISNGTPVTAGPTSATGALGTGQPLAIGGYAITPTSFSYNGYIAEVVITDVIPTTAQQNQMYSYGSILYGGAAF